MFDGRRLKIKGFSPYIAHFKFQVSKTQETNCLLLGACILFLRLTRGNIPPMPLLQSALKKMRKDKTRTARNEKRRSALKRVLKTAKKTPEKKSLTAAFSNLDKAVKVNLIHKNKAARLKSRLAKLLAAK